MTDDKLRETANRMLLSKIRDCLPKLTSLEYGITFTQEIAEELVKTRSEEDASSISTILRNLYVKLS